MAKLFVFACTIALSLSAFGHQDANQNSVPILDGNPVHVVSAKLVKNVEPVLPPNGGQPPYSADLIATIKYNAGCNPTQSIVVTKSGQFDFQIFETHVRLPAHRARCFAIMLMTTDIKVANFFESQPDPQYLKSLQAITVNGVTVSQQ